MECLPQAPVAPAVVDYQGRCVSLEKFFNQKEATGAAGREQEVGFLAGKVMTILDAIDQKKYILSDTILKVINTTAFILQCAQLAQPLMMVGLHWALTHGKISYNKWNIWLYTGAWMTFNVAVFFFRNSIQEIQGFAKAKSAPARTTSVRQVIWESGIQQIFAHGVKQMNEVLKRNECHDLAALVPKNLNMLGEEWTEKVFEDLNANFKNVTLNSPIAVSMDKSHTPYLTLRVREKFTQQNHDNQDDYENAQTGPIFITLYPIIPGVDFDHSSLPGSSYKWVVEGSEYKKLKISNELNFDPVRRNGGIGSSFHMLDNSTRTMQLQQHQALESQLEEDEEEYEKHEEIQVNRLSLSSSAPIRLEPNFETLDAIISGKHPTLELDRNG